MNSVVLAYGMLVGGKEGANKKLHPCWQHISSAVHVFNPCQQFPWEQFWYGPKNMDQSMGYMLVEFITRWFSPYQLNPMDINPLKEILLTHVI